MLAPQPNTGGAANSSPNFAMVSTLFCFFSRPQQALFGFNPGVTVLVEFDHLDQRPSKPATPGDKRASEALPIFEGSEVIHAERAVWCFVDCVALVL